MMLLEHRRGGPGITVEDADLVIVQAHVVERRKPRAERFAQRRVERVDRSIARSCCVKQHALHLDLDRRLGVHGASVLPHLRGEVGDRPGRDVAGLQTADQHLERRVGRFVRVALVLKLLQMAHQPSRLRVITVELQPELTRLGEHVAPT